MSLFSNLLNQPEAKRKKIMWIIISAIVAVILLIWILLLAKGYIVKLNPNTDYFSSAKKLQGDLKKNLPNFNNQKNTQNQAIVNENLKQDNINQSQPRLPLE